MKVLFDDGVSLGRSQEVFAASTVNSLVVKGNAEAYNTLP